MKSNLFGKLAMVITLLMSTVTPSFAGRYSGPGIDSNRVLAYGTFTYKEVFRAGELAVVTVTGDHTTDLDLYVYDEHGNPIASDTDYSDSCAVSWTPRWTGVFTIVVVNRGRVYNDFTLRTN